VKIKEKFNELKGDRRFHFLLALTFIIVMTILPFSGSMSESEQNNIKVQMKEKFSDMDAFLIFGNNLSIALLTLVPILGIPWIGQVMFNTGRVLLAFQTSPILLLLSPIAWLEYGIYSYTLMRSIYLVKGLFEEKYRETFVLLKDTVFFIVIGLMVGAIFEVALYG